MWRKYHDVIKIALYGKILVLGIISFGFIYFSSNPRSSLDVWQLWNVWDSPHYLSIAQSGYQKTGVAANFIVFLPLFPALISLTKLIFQLNFLLSAYLVSFLASILLAIMLYKLTLIDYSNKIAVWTVIFLFLFPTAFFLHIPYTESLFMLLVVSAFYFARRRNYLLSFFLVSLAGLTRLSGLALIPAIFIEAFVLDKENFSRISIYKRLHIFVIFLIICLSGFLLFLILNFLVYGNPFQFVEAEKQNWHTSFSPNGEGLINAIGNLYWRTGAEKMMLGYGQIIAFWFGLLSTIYVLFKVRLSYGIYMLFVLWSAFSMSFWLSMPRYVLSLFPSFIALSILLQNQVLKYIWLSLSAGMLIILSLMFILYGPVF